MNRIDVLIWANIGWFILNTMASVANAFNAKANKKMADELLEFHKKRMALS